MEESSVFTTDQNADLQKQIDDLKNQLGQFNPRSLSSTKESATTRKLILSTTAILGEDVINGNGLRVGVDGDTTSQHSEVFQSEATTDATNLILTRHNDSGAGVRRLAQSFKLNGNLTEKLKSVTVKMDKSAATSDANHVADLCSDSSGVPSSVLATSDTRSFGTNAAGTEITFTWGSNQSLSLNTTYWIVFRSTTLPAASTIIYLQGSSSASGYTNGLCKYSTDTGGNWTDTTKDLYFRLGFADTGGRIYKSSGLNSTVTDTFIGVAQSANSKGFTPDVISSGVKSDFSGLTAGSVYYLSDTAGALSTTPGTSSKRAGIALDSTNMFILSS